ncbi:MAG: IS1634 family transposase [Syntrophobacteria bacterium]
MYKKITRGRTYWYLREVHRVRGKVKLKWQKYLGTAETILAKLQEAERLGKPAKLKTGAFGAVFVAHVLEQELGVIDIIDSIVPRARNETGPTVGDYFFYAWANRMIAPRSKRALSDWYRKTAVQQIRPVDLKELTSERYWEKWDRVSKEQVEEIGRRFFKRLWSERQEGPESILFDTTNYFTYMARKTKSELAVRGKNPAERGTSKHHLRQVGVGLLVDRQSSLPLYYTVYPGNLHDSRLFRQVMDELFGVIMGFRQGDQELTVVFDKGMNSGENISLIDGERQIHFLTTYSTYFAEELARLDPKHFAVLETGKNRKLLAKGKEEDLLLAYRTTRTLWGRERTVVVTFNPVTRRKKLYDFTKKMERLRTELMEYRRKYQNKEPKWRSPKAIVSRYRKLCEDLYISHSYYRISFTEEAMRFRKDSSEIASARAMMGKNIIVTDNHHWSTEDIVTASLDRSRIENQFRTSKARCHVRVNPMFHWTDSKIRCHLLSCVIALSCLRLLELKVGGGHNAKTIMEEMQHLDCVLSWRNGARKPEMQIEDPTELQAHVLTALGYQIKDGWVLQAAA